MNLSIKIIINFGLCLFFFGAGCATPIPESVQKDEEVYNEPVDTACSYFYFMWGRSAELAERYEEAMDAYGKALVCDPQADLIARKRSVLLINLGRKHQAIEAMEKIISKNPADIETLTLLGNLHAAMDNHEQAVKVYQSILDVDPNDSHTLLLLGSLYARERQYSQAQDVLEHLVEVDPDAFMAHNYLAKLYRELRYFEKSFATYEKALELSWSSHLAFELAGFYESRNRYEDAEDVYLRIYDNDDRNEKALERLIGHYLRQKKVDEALTQLERLRGLRENDEKLDLTIGRILLDQKFYAEAMDHFSRMLNEDQGEPDMVLTLLAMACYESGLKEKARTVLSEIPPESEVFEDSVLMRVKMLQEQNELASAEKLLQQMIQADNSRRPGFYYILAGLYHKLGRSGDGRDIFNQAERAYPDDTKILFEYALYLDRLGDVDAALLKMEKVLHLDPDDSYALNYVGYTWADRGIHLDRALEYIKRAVVGKPEDGYVRDSLGWVYFKRAEYTLAVREMKKAVMLQGDDPTIHDHLGDAFMKLENTKKALDAYKKALELFRDEKKKDRVRDKIEDIR